MLSYNQLLNFLAINIQSQIPKTVKKFTEAENIFLLALPQFKKK